MTAVELTEGANPSITGASEVDTVLGRTEGEKRTVLTLTRGPASTAADVACGCNRVIPGGEGTRGAIETVALG